MADRSEHRSGMSQSEAFYKALIPDGVHLAPSRKTEGGFRGATLDNETNELRGQAEFVEVNPADDSDDEDSSGAPIPPLLAAALGIAAGVLGTIVVVKQAPRIKSWWLEAALPGLRSKWATLTKSKDEGTESADDDGAIRVGDFSRELTVAVDDQRSAMSSTEAQQRFLTLLLAAAIVADQTRLLKDARIVDDAQLLGLRGAMETITGPEVAEMANGLLEADTGLLDDGTREIFLQVFGGGALVDGHYVPLRPEQIESALHLPDDKRSP